MNTPPSAPRAPHSVGDEPLSTSGLRPPSVDTAASGGSSVPARSSEPADRALLDALPPSLRARTRVRVAGPPRRPAPFVLYWMRVAVRADENAALDVALTAANALQLPLLVYHAVSERYPYASDRHHTFILEGARDVGEALAARGIAYALHVERPGARGPHLRTLGSEAALVVTEAFHVPPLDAWTARLGEALAAKGVPLWEVDASCIVPMPMVTRATPVDRAYAFRTATRRIASASLGSGSPVVAPAIDAGAIDPRSFPFTPIDPRGLDDAGIARVVATCAIDHGVAPIRALRGGGRAGYARWTAFLRDRLSRYARDRNDALLDGTSRLSPYLHYGHISALRLAREASHALGDGPDKFLDELLVWREVAWHFCANTDPRALDSLASLPAWAQQTLQAHAADPRDLRTDEQLARGQTGDALWDAAQRSLLAHGELHNNVRMTWGKALLGWTRDPEAARRALVDLNHRYALDGRDPSSYGGLYWCLGLFDRPFSPEQPVMGAVRPRPTQQHAQRLDVTRYAATVARPTRRAIARVAVIGGGLAGLSCARVLADHNVEVVVFDKGRSPGGRLATRRLEGGGVDLGAQYFTARDPRFSRWLPAWRAAGILEVWRGRIVKLDGAGGAPTATEPLLRWVGLPDMNALARHLARGLDVRTGHRVDRLDRVSGAPHARWQLRGTVAERGATLAPSDPTASQAAAHGFGDFDAIAVCLPADQTAPLIAHAAPAIAHAIASTSLEPCLALALVVDADGPDARRLRALAFDGAFIGRPDDADPLPLSWIARDSSKPGRAPGERWMLHASAAWSRAHYPPPGESDERAVVDAMLAAFARACGLDAIAPARTHLHRWRFARAPVPLREGAFVDEEAHLAVGGDWADGGRVEGAFLSGVAVAGRLLGLPEP